MISPGRPPCALIWFSEDLRLTDNPAVTAAVASGLPVTALFLLDEQGQVINDTPSQGLAGMRGVSLLMSGVAPRDGDFFLLVAADNRDLGQEIILDQLSDAGLVTAPRRGTPMRSYPIGEIRAYGSQRL